MLSRLCIALTLNLGAAAMCPAAIATLMVQGAPGDFLTQGQSLTFTYDTDRGSTIFTNELTLAADGLPTVQQLGLRDPVNGGSLDSASLRIESEQVQPNPLASLAPGISLMPNAFPTPAVVWQALTSGCKAAATTR